MKLGGHMLRKISYIAALVCFALATPILAQRESPMSAQQAKAMAALAFLDGEWAGPAIALEPKGSIRMTQTERVGTLLGGTIRLVEGRAFDAGGKTLFNAFAVISYDARVARYIITSHAGGYSTTTELKLTATGFEWEIPAGPGAKMHFTAVVKDGVWKEVGDFVSGNAPPRRTFEMTVRRLRPSKWPAGELVAHP